MKKLLFVDDRTKRITSALKKYSDDFEITIACNNLEFLREINKNYFDVWSLDCDLGGRDYVDPESQDSIFSAIVYIQKLGWPAGKVRPRYIKIHSSNEFASESLKATLETMGFNVYLERFIYE